MVFVVAAELASLQGGVVAVGQMLPQPRLPLLEAAPHLSAGVAGTTRGGEGGDKEVLSRGGAAAVESGATE